jgi:hypothetical protein
MINDTASGPGFVSLLEAFRASGGTAPADIVSRLLEDHPAGETASLTKLVHTKQVFGFEWRSKLWIPMFQFNSDDLCVAAAPQAIRSELPELWSGWILAGWFALPNVQLGGRRPVDWLAGDFAAVLQAARASPPPSEQTTVRSRRKPELAAHP